MKKYNIKKYKMVNKLFKFANGYWIICIPNRVNMIKVLINIQYIIWLTG